MDLGTTDVPSFASLEETRSALERVGTAFKAGDGWIKALGSEHSVHYEFRDGTLALVTLMLNNG